jgi:putative transport protein
MLAYLFEFLGKDTYLLLFLVVGLAYALGSVNIKGYGLGTTASAIIIGTVVSTIASTYGQQYRIDEFTKLLFYYLFMYAVGLRVGPSFINGLKGDGFKFALLAFVCASTGLLLAVILANAFELPAGSAAGILAGAMTMSAALGAADQAVSTGAYAIPAGMSADQVSANIALAYGVTYVWGTVGIILIVKYLPKIFRVDARAAARQYEKEVGVPSSDSEGITAYQSYGARAYQLNNPGTIGRTIGDMRNDYPTYRWLRVERAGQMLEAKDDLQLQSADVIVLLASLEDLTANMGLIGPEVPDSKALNVPLDQAQILVTEKSFETSDIAYLRREFGGSVQLLKMERDGVSVPIGTSSTGMPRRGDILHVLGIKTAIDRLAKAAGTITRPTVATDLMVLSIGMMLGFLIGHMEIEIAGLPIGLGAAGGLLVSGVIVASLLSRYPVFPPTPSSSRQLMEDLGLTVFVAIVGINVGSTLLSSLSGSIALYLLLAGFIVTTLPPFLVWIIGQYVFKLNYAVLMGATAGARSHSAPCREAAEEIGSTVPWIGFSVGYAVAGVLLTVYGYVAMIL